LNGKLSEAQAKAIDLLVDLTKLFITFALGVIGALAYAVKVRSEKIRIPSSYELSLLIVTAVSALASIYFGHLILTTLIEMLSNDFLTLLAPEIVRSVRAQHVCLLISVLGLLFFLYETFTAPDAHRSRRT